MSKEFGQIRQLKTSEDYIIELQEIIGVMPPTEVQVVDGKLVYFKFEETWKEGHTELVKKLNEDGVEVDEYVEHYEDKRLTSTQIKKIEKWVGENLSVD